MRKLNVLEFSPYLIVCASIPAAAAVPIASHVRSRTLKIFPGTRMSWISRPTPTAIVKPIAPPSAAL